MPLAATAAERPGMLKSRIMLLKIDKPLPAAPGCPTCRANAQSMHGHSYRVNSRLELEAIGRPNPDRGLAQNGYCGYHLCD